MYYLYVIKEHIYLFNADINTQVLIRGGIENRERRREVLGSKEQRRIKM